MHDAAAPAVFENKPITSSANRFSDFKATTVVQVCLTVLSAALLVLSFPNFDFSWLAWIALAPLIFVLGQGPKPARALVLGWLWGVLFFYGSCWWLTYPMIHYGRLPGWLAYLLLVLPVSLGALFPAGFCVLQARLIARFGPVAIFAATVLWISFEWLRYAVTGQVWNAVGYSQAFHPMLIQTARWGGVYAISFLIILIGSSIAYAMVVRTQRALLRSSICCALAAGLMILAEVPVSFEKGPNVSGQPSAIVVAVQPNVPMEWINEQTENGLVTRHVELGKESLQKWSRLGVISNDGSRSVDSDRAQEDSEKSRSKIPRVVVWPESPMNFVYSTDPRLQKVVADFAIANHTAVLLNSLEPAPNDGNYNSAILVNEEGRKVAQYDKIRLMPFGEYVPLPRWLPGASSVRAIVGEFTPGSSFTLMPLGAIRVGVFICVESTHPAIARAFTNQGADVLINISNDGYLGPTAVMRQHLGNAIFRAVENDRPVLRVTNTGISASISSSGQMWDQTRGFESGARIWAVNGRNTATFYSRHGDVLVYLCLLIALGLASASFSRSSTKG